MAASKLMPVSTGTRCGENVNVENGSVGTGCDSSTMSIGVSVKTLRISVNTCSRTTGSRSTSSCRSSSVNESGSVKPGSDKKCGSNFTSTVWPLGGAKLG